MTTARTSLQYELEQWERHLARMTDEELALDPGREQLMATIQATLVAYRSHILPALDTGTADAATAPYDAVIADEVVRTVDRLEALRADLVAGAPVVELHLRLNETLAALRALTRVAVRLTQA